ncbi:MAG TPA: acylphosphatase [Bacteroidetes bacterium]|nr:acylphosphatase [Bacteroidota bacterium]
MKHLKIKVTGKVQGVWFRASTKDKADELGLHGYVKNEPDGSVFIEVSGDEDLIEKFLKWVKEGPELARVDDLIVEENDLEYNDGFVIKR